MAKQKQPAESEATGFEQPQETAQPPEPDKKTTEYLQYYFTQDELLKHAKEQARTGSEKRVLEMKKAQITKQLSGEIAEKDAELDRLGNLVSNGYEWRNIECGIWYDRPKKGCCQIIRIDTGEVVKERRMTEGELQMQLELEKEAESIAEQVADAAVEQINAGALGPDVTARRL